MVPFRNVKNNNISLLIIFRMFHNVWSFRRVFTVKTCVLLLFFIADYAIYNCRPERRGTPPQIIDGPVKNPYTLVLYYTSYIIEGARTQSIGNNVTAITQSKYVLTQYIHVRATSVRKVTLVFERISYRNRRRRNIIKK